MCVSVKEQHEGNLHGDRRVLQLDYGAGAGNLDM